jgi:hypothetical protein
MYLFHDGLKINFENSRNIYFALKNLILPHYAGSSMSQACPALRGILY